MDGAVAPLKRERAEAPQTRVKTRRSRAGGGRGELLDGREPMGGSRPPRRTHSAWGQRFSGGAPPPNLTSLLVSTCRLGGAAGRHSHNALGRAAAVAAASATASGRRWRKAERRI